MSAGPSLYRRHRPRTFADVVGQEHVVRTLRNAIEQGKVHHAYLFVGSRGTGKTSMAKMLAACMNCEHGPTVSPCGRCDSCTAIASATSMDVVEMDAASNNSVDDIRALRDAVAYAPVTGRSKVYILDEAHMLSSQAWNAFLKTLEEPPPHTIFVLATTEANKVLPTVVDRCHRFDFHRPTVDQLVTVLTRVAGQEGIAIGPEAISLIARHATGSFRDALGTLEQLVTYSGERIETGDVLAVLGVADADLLFGALDAVAAGDARGALHAAARIAATGRDLGQACRDLEVHARELLVVQTLGAVPASLRVTPDRDERLAAQAAAVPGASVVRLLDLLAGAMRAMKDGADPRTQLELALVKAAAPEVDPSARALQARLERLEAALAAGGAQARPAATAPQTPAARAAAPGPAAPPPTASAPAAPVPVAPAPAAPTSAAPTRATSSTPAVQDVAQVDDWVPAGAPSEDDEWADRARAATPAASAATSPPAAAPPAAALAEAPARAAPLAATAPGVPPAAAAPPAAATSSTPAPAATVPALAPDLAAVVAVWPAVLGTLRDDNGLLGAALAEGLPVAVAGTEVVVAFAPDQAFHRRMCEAGAHKELIASALRTHAGGTWRVRFETRTDLAPPASDEPPTEDELIVRLQAAFDATEILPDDAEEA